MKLIKYILLLLCFASALNAEILDNGNINSILEEGMSGTSAERKELTELGVILMHGILAAITALSPLYFLVTASSKRIAEAVNNAASESIRSSEPFKFALNAFVVLIMVGLSYGFLIYMCDNVLMTSFAPSMGPNSNTSKFWTIPILTSVSGGLGPYSIILYQIIQSLRIVFEMMIIISVVLVFMQCFSLSTSYLTQRANDSEISGTLVLTLAVTLVMSIMVIGLWDFLGHPILNTPISFIEIAQTFIKDGINMNMNGDLL